MTHRQVGKMAVDDLPGRLTAWLAPLADRNLFNPSILSVDGILHLVYRAFAPGSTTKPFRAYYTRFDPALGPDQPTQLVDLTEASGVEKVADPKLFEADGRVFATFNTGHLTPEARNEVYVMQVAPELSTPQRCVLEPRRATEKNWAFFIRDGVLRVFYSLDPLTELTLVSGRLGGDDDLVFRHPTAPVEAGSPQLGEGRWLLLGKRKLTLGTQPVLFDGDLYLVAHEKLNVSKYRVYVGKLVRLRRDAAGHERMTLSSHRLIHSRRAAWPHLGGVHNPTVLCVTYFSGLTVHDGRLLVSYGINDTHAGFAQLSPRLMGRDSGR